MSVSRRLRFHILYRDNFTCHYCGRRPPFVTLEVDHIHPCSKGGKDVSANLITACYDCNHGKAAFVINYDSFDQFDELSWTKDGLIPPSKGGGDDRFSSDSEQYDPAMPDWFYDHIRGPLKLDWDVSVEAAREVPSICNSQLTSEEIERIAEAF